MMSDLLFYGLVTTLVLLSLLAVSLPNLLHGAIALIGSFFATAALYIMLQLEFVALSQIMLYIGGIIIFMLIIILLTSGLGQENRYMVKGRRRAAGAGVSALLLIGLLLTISQPSETLQKATLRAAPVTMDDIGFRLMATNKNGFIIPFEIISILLLVALVGAVVIARRDNGQEQES
ncbi:NADH:ubiquinone oxidoreductase subunit J [bacterium BMS3Bbin14]|nr:NADH:ubiquinone oxidoreductase subunit J [bacterium BMS3Abin13]GBE51935.1 NADH:ubiquinone oxidoreductase subunit J [bacterium BMS3Bbin14]HDK42966.1 NADH-quinone oxidoreductase subunit J [Desulfobacteraceae bacterium]HDO29492.1 NADH-quinone oxidoreductase subunit J [Desulfobacteraceae bacterium]HDZ76420.1 NADH-quinone oxidoreductase subunit J [Desulfobacteraceae bacterium]